MKTVAVIGGQSIFDIAIQHCGSIDAAYTIALLNSLTLDATLTSGQFLLVPEVTDKRVVDELLRKSVVPGSGWVAPPPVPPEPIILNLRLPTEAEWIAEKLSWISGDYGGAFNSPLKLPTASYRDGIDGSIYSAEVQGSYWSSGKSNPYNSWFLFFAMFDAYMGAFYRAYGCSVRLIKDGTFSQAQFAAMAADTVEIDGLTYGYCYNPTTGRIWLDRNLGATKVAASSTDADAYGWLYQWGRATDGHQIRTSATTANLSNSDSPGHGDFITSNASPYDWRDPQNDNLWQGVDGINNPANS